MRETLPRPLAAALLGAALSLGAAPAAHAQSSAGWQFEAAIYGWFPAISGNTYFPAVDGGPSIYVSKADVLDSLEFAFMGNLQARNGVWGVWTDLVYASFGASKNGTRDFRIGGDRPPVGVTANLDLDVKSWIWTLAGTYSLKADPDGNTDLLFGARLIDMTNTLDFSLSAQVPPYPSRSGNVEATLSNWDAVVGLKGQLNFGDARRWFVPYYVDVGAGESKLTWQVQAGLGYQFDWGAVIATWRYLDYEFKDSSNIRDMAFSGPTIGVAFKF
jgi:hypothetical protein